MQAAAPQAVVLGTSASRLHRILKTVYAMLRKRGYVVPDDFLRMKAELFAEKYGSDIVNRKAMTVLAFKESNVDEKIYVFFPDGDISAKEITAEIIGPMTRDGVRRAIIVINGKFSSSAKQGLAEMAHDYVVEDFKEEQLLVDITEHDLVPLHTVLSEEEKEELLSRYKLKEAQLPRILSTDPVARFYGMRHGQVVKITRDSETAGRYISYRVVV